MKVYRSIEEFPKLPATVVTSGSFDGVHFAHQKILARVVESAQKADAESVLITFWPHPRTVLFPDKHVELLTTLEEKAFLLEKYGIDHLLVVPFTKEFSQTSSSDFIQEVVIDTIGTQKLIIGYDHRFGKNREGSFQYLQENAASFGFEVEEIPRQEIDATTVSSTQIRDCLKSGDLQKANHYLNHPYMLSGEVVKGDQLGRTIGYPTANLGLHFADKLLPKLGVYAVNVSVGEQLYGGMLNIGYRPTVGKEPVLRLEVHLFSFEKDIYGEHIQIHLLQYIREEQRFSSIEALKNQLDMDKQQALGFIQKSKSV